MLLTSALVLAATLVYLSSATRTFQSEAKLYVRLGRESVALDPTATTGQTVSLGDSRENEINAIGELLASRQIIEQVVDQFGPDVVLERVGKPKSVPKEAIKKALRTLEPYNLNPLKVYSIRDKAIAHFQENLGIQTAKKTAVISLTYECESPRLAEQLLGALIEHSRNEHLRINRTKGSHQFFEQQAEILHGSLKAHEVELRELKDATGLASFEQQRELHLARIGMLEDELARGQADLRAAEAELASRQKLLADLPAMIVAEQVTGQPQTPEFNMRQRLFDLEIQEQELLAKLSPDNPRIVQIRQQLAEMRGILGDESLKTQVTRSINKTREAADLAMHERSAQIASLQARAATLGSQIAAANAAVQKLNDHEIKLARLQREIDLAAVNYRKYAENLEQARIDHELEEAKISSINIMQPPSYSETPANPKMFVVLALGFVLALGASATVALLAERRRQKRRPIPVIVSRTPSRAEAMPVAADLEPTPEPAVELVAKANGHGPHRAAAVAREHIPTNPR